MNQKVPTESNNQSDNNGPDQVDIVTPPQPLGHPPGLHYNIQVHLPATKDIEVYNAIFKSLKEHLY